MNVIFLTITPIDNLSSPSVHVGILKQFRDNGNNVYIVTPYERKREKRSELVKTDGVNILHVKTGNITKCGIVEKGITTITIDRLYYIAIKKYLKGIIFDLVLYSTPPITLCGVIKRLKLKDNAITYLMLKDIFPQNAIDMGLLQKKGYQSCVYTYFRKKEKQLYKLSDYIGCMSQANINYILRHNSFLVADNVEICPNTTDIIDYSINEKEKEYVRKKYNIPMNNIVFVYGGNLGKPQGVPFIVRCLEKSRSIANVLFVIIGDGTEYNTIKNYVSENEKANIILMNRLEKKEYEKVVAACDVGLIFLDHRFTIPNFPSRLLSYMLAKKPVLACTDPNTDIGEVITEGDFGWWCESNNEANFAKMVSEIATCKELQQMGEKGFDYLQKNYSSQKGYEIIAKRTTVNK